MSFLILFGILNRDAFLNSEIQDLAVSLREEERLSVDWPNLWGHLLEKERHLPVVFQSLHICSAFLRMGDVGMVGFPSILLVFLILWLSMKLWMWERLEPEIDQLFPPIDWWTVKNLLGVFSLEIKRKCGLNYQVLNFEKSDTFFSLYIHNVNIFSLGDTCRRLDVLAKYGLNFL